MDQVLTVIAAGGGIGIWPILYFVWRLERRLYRVELHLEIENGNQSA